MSMTRPILLLSAVERECAPLRDLLGTPEDVNTYRVGGQPVYLMTTGIGAVNAALTVAQIGNRLTAGGAAGLVIQFGCGGAYHGSGLDAGDIAVADFEHYGDLGVETPTGWQGIEDIGFPVVGEDEDAREYNRLAITGPSELLLSAARWVASRDGCSARIGGFVTVNTCTGTRTRSQELEARWNGICENMEGAGALHACRRFGLEFCEVRGISNIVEDRRRDAWDIDTAARRACDTVHEFLLAQQEKASSSQSA